MQRIPCALRGAAPGSLRAAHAVPPLHQRLHHRIAQRGLISTCALPRPCTQFHSENADSETKASVDGRMKGTISGLDSLVPSSAPKPSPAASHASPSSTPESTPSAKPSTRVEKTMLGLDALLGVKPEPEAPKGGKLGADFKASVSKKLEGDEATADRSAVSMSPEAIDQLAEVLSKGDPEKKVLLKAELTEQIMKIAEQTKKIESGMSSTDPAKMTEKEKADMMKPVMMMLDLSSLEMMKKEEIKQLKDVAFGPQTFWVTETTPIQDADRMGLLVRGNLRDDRDKVFKHVCDKVEKLFKGRFEVLMVEDEQAEKDEFSPPSPLGSKSTGKATGVVDRGPPVSFQIVPAAQAQPPQTDNIQIIAAVILGILFFGTCCELGIASNIAKLPQETLDWISDPANLDSDQVPPGLATWDASTILTSAVPVISSLIGINVAHEIGHRIAATIKNVKLGPTFFIPSMQIGAFGAITPFKSLLKDRSTLWDVSAAGPAAGLAASLAILFIGLASSDPNQVPVDMLVPVPTPLFQSSLLLGTLTKFTLGETALRGAQVLVNPLAIAGWYGTIITALNMLPVGCLDGGRMVQGAFGKSTLTLTSFFVYLGLGLGLLAGPISLPYGLYLLITQRSPERFIKDNVAPAGDARQAVTIAAIVTAVLVLLPMAPELADAWGVGPSDPFS